MHPPPPMPRRKTIISSLYPYHVTNRCINKDWFRIPILEVWEIFSNYLFACHHWFQLEIYSFVLMNNHFHLICQTPKGNLPEIMNYFLREVSRSITLQSGRINQTFGGPYYSSLIKSNHYLTNVYKYVYRNPVDANITSDVSSYRYSTLQLKIGANHDIIPLISDPFLFNPHFDEELFSWLNKKPDAGNLQTIKKSLKHSEFRLPKDRNNGRKHPLENQLI